MIMFKVCPANKSESRNILLISAAFLLINFMNFLYPSVELIKYFLKDTGLFTHPDSACVMLNLTGIPCAFCGLSRSLIALINLDVSGALYYNPSSVVFYPLAGFSFASVVALALSGQKIVITNWKIFGTILLVILTLLWLVNIFFGHQTN